MSLAAAIAVGVAGNVADAWVVYYVGLYSGRPFIERYGRYACSGPNTSGAPNAGSQGAAPSPSSSVASSPA